MLKLALQYRAVARSPITAFARSSTASFSAEAAAAPATGNTNTNNNTNNNNKKIFPLSKIVATIGPASEQLPDLTKVTEAGLNIMRINFSHATFDEADLRTKNLRQCPGLGMGLDQNNMRAVLLDTQGPEVRSGSFANGVKEVEFVKGSKVTLTTDPAFQKKQTAEVLWVSYDKLPNTVKVGDNVLLDDGSLQLQVKSKEGGVIVCEVMNNHLLGSKKGVNFPGLVVDLPAMDTKDFDDLRWGMRNDIDFIAASFTRKASDVIEMREFCKKYMEELHGANHNKPLPLIISKVENTEALDNIDDIIRVSDGVMVARGDLGVEIPMETLARWQKKIVRKCNFAGKPVVVATQMLESMQKNPRPTRAECTDVANACFDGADCVMLSGESAKGKYPWGSVSMMQSIIKDAEKGFREEGEFFPQFVPENSKMKTNLAQSVVNSADLANAACIVVSNPQFAATIASCRPNVPIVTLVTDAKVGRQLQIWRGIHPVLVDKVKSDRENVSLARSLGFCNRHDHVVVVSNDQITHKESATITTKILKSS